MVTKDLTKEEELNGQISFLKNQLEKSEKELEEEQKNSYFWYEKYKKLNVKYNNFRKAALNVALMAEEEVEI